MKEKNSVIRAIDSTGTFRIFLADTKKMVEDIRKIHNSSPLGTAILGRTITGASMMALFAKGEDDKLTLTINGGGPAGHIVAVANSSGNVKAYMDYPQVDLPSKIDGKLNVGEAVGKNGKLTVIKDFGFRDPYIGQVDLVSGEIAEDLTSYFAISEQLATSVALGVLIDVDCTVRQAGGFIIQVLPEPDEAVLTKLEEIILKLPPITAMMEECQDLKELQNRIFKGMEIEILDETFPELKCDCSMERMEEALISIGKKDIKEMIEEDGKAELVCHFCNHKYSFDKAHLERLLSDM